MSDPVILAAYGAPSLLLIVTGLAAVLLLLGALGYGSHCAGRERDPRARQSKQTSQAAARSNSWKTPAEETAERF
ncbi:hypothetical protein [Streptomyces sp. NPDC102487]|uniref:hypothetical protein n=1 Tax=Streptomyces sp. NPDC102487 TaxID=3366182 RepID=UPI00382218C0